MQRDESPPTREPDRTEWVKYRLRVLGFSMGAISRSLGLHRTVASKVFSRRYPRVEEAIARALQLKPQEIWPERYVDGEPIQLPRGRRPDVRHVAGNTTPGRQGKKSAPAARGVRPRPTPPNSGDIR